MSAESPPTARSDRPVTLVGGAPTTREILDRALSRAPVPMAADGGAEALLSRGIVPERVFGDLDSLSAEAIDRLGDRAVRIHDQDTTDLQKCLALIDAPLILGVGFLGGRLDHTLSSLGTLMGQGDRPVVLLGEADVAMHLAGAVTLDLPPGARVSLMPLAPVRIRSEGLRWKTGALTLAPGGRDGCSNEATGPVTLNPAGPGTILVLDSSMLDPLLAGDGPGAPSRFAEPKQPRKGA